MPHLFDMVRNPGLLTKATNSVEFNSIEPQKMTIQAAILELVHHLAKFPKSANGPSPFVFPFEPPSIHK